ncbi:MAG TPA: 5-formyltetrahydrofolate cyclo-ligase [Alphaproteobacteria bacterium]
MTEDATRAAKAKLREDAKARRARLRPEDAAAAALAVRDRVLAAGLVPAGATVSGFWPIGDEFDPRPLMEALARRGHTLCLPVVVGRGRPLAFRAWAPGDPLERAGFGLSVPAWDAPPAIPRFLVVPLLAFDRRGYRLGYGAGYYDRTIAELRARSKHVFALGVGFALQEAPEVPVMAHDQRLDAIATEDYLIGPFD